MRVPLDRPLILSSIEVFPEPFRHFTSADVFADDISVKIIEWLEAGAPWKLVETDFYEQYEFSFLDVLLPSHLTFLQAQPFLDDLTKRMDSLFGTPLSGRIDLTAHKLIPGQRIRVHNDFIPEQETHRLLIQLNRVWNDEQGGLLLFFNSQKSTDIHKIFRPLHNTAVGFAISSDSHHAVSTVHAGDRFTLVYSFYERSKNA